MALYMTLLVVILFVRDVITIDINQVFILSFLVLALITLPYDKCFYYTCFLIPFVCGVNAYITLLAFLILSYKRGSMKYEAIIIALFLGLVELVNFVSYSFIVEYNQLFLYISHLLLFFYILFSCNDAEIKPVEVLRFYILGSGLVMSLYCIQLFVNYDITSVFSGLGRMMDIDVETEVARTGIMLNANSLAYYSIINISILLLGRGTINLTKLGFTLLLVISLFSGIISFSRTWLLLFIVILCLTLINSQKSNRRVVIFIICIGFLALILSQSYFDMVSDYFADRFTASNMKTAGERTQLFAAYNKIWGNNIHLIIFGSGVSHYKEVANLWNSIHSGFQQLYFCTGIVGSVVFIFSFFTVFKQSKVQKYPAMYFMPFLACVIFDQSIQFLKPNFLMLPFAIVVYALFLDRYKV